MQRSAKSQVVLIDQSVSLSLRSTEAQKHRNTEALERNLDMKLVLRSSDCNEERAQNNLSLLRDDLSEHVASIFISMII